MSKYLAASRGRRSFPKYAIVALVCVALVVAYRSRAPESDSSGVLPPSRAPPSTPSPRRAPFADLKARKKQQKAFGDSGMAGAEGQGSNARELGFKQAKDGDRQPWEHPSRPPPSRLDELAPERPVRLPAVVVRPDPESDRALDRANANLRDGDGDGDRDRDRDELDADEPIAPREVDEDELDVAQRIRQGSKGSVNKLNKPYVPGTAAKPKGKKPNLQAGVQAGENEELKWRGGWSERFKQKPDAGIDAAAAAAAGAEPLGVSKDDLSPPPRPRVVDTAPKPNTVAILAHPLVARFASQRFARAVSPPSVQEESFQANPDASTPRTALERTNVTLCALVPSETRFLPEWLAYHALLGVERFALYDTSAAGAVGAEEIDGLADQMEEEGKGEAAPKAAEIKAGIGRTASGLDETGRVWPERIAGLERWIEQGVVAFHWMKFQDTKKARSFHEDMMQHCSATYASSTNFLAHLDVDEFVVLSDTLYDTNAPYAQGDEWRYPLHDFLAKPSAHEAACIPIPQLRFRNVGVKTLAPGSGVLTTQTRRDIVDSEHRNLPEKTLLHTAFTASFVHFDGPHSCRVDSATKMPKGVTREIRDSQGEVLQSGGTFKSTRLPTEPLAIAHFFQRDLTDCRQKMAVVQDPNSLHMKGRGTVECEEQYLPSQAELSSPSFVADAQNRFLLHLPPPGSVVEDLRARDSWAAKAAKAVMDSWAERKPPSASEIEAARERVVMLVF